MSDWVVYNAAFKKAILEDSGEFTVEEILSKFKCCCKDKLQIVKTEEIPHNNGLRYALRCNTCGTICTLQKE